MTMTMTMMMRKSYSRLSASLGPKVLQRSRRFSSSTSSSSSSSSPSSKMTAAEREAARREANEKLREYHINRPPLEVIYQSKRRSRQRETEHGMQLTLLGAFLAAFAGAVALGRKIALDDDFRGKYVPSWYDFSIKKPKSEFTRDERHESLVNMQIDLHQRAIRGEFTPERLEQMRQRFAGIDDLEGDDDDDDDDDDNDDDDDTAEGTKEKESNAVAGSAWRN